MSEPNYNESIVIPLLQNKFRELTNTNLVLEANLLIERAKNADLTEKYNLLLNKLDKKKKNEK
jgi:hypothetical protein